MTQNRSDEEIDLEANEIVRETDEKLRDLKYLNDALRVLRMFLREHRGMVNRLPIYLGKILQADLQKRKTALYGLRTRANRRERLKKKK